MPVSHLIGHVKITSFRDKHLYETEQLIRQHPRVFSAEDIILFGQDLLTYLRDHRQIGERARIVVLQVNGKIDGCIVFFRQPGSRDYYKIEWLVLSKEILPTSRETKRRSIFTKPGACAKWEHSLISIRIRCEAERHQRTKSFSGNTSADSSSERRFLW